MLRQLDSGDFASEQTLSEHEALFRAALGERYARFGEAVHNFEFDAAIEPLRAVLAENPALP